MSIVSVWAGTLKRHYQLSSVPPMTFGNIYGIILKVVEIQCFEMKSCVSGSLLILCRLLKADDTSLINGIQRKVDIFFLQILNFTIVNSIKNRRRYVCAERCLEYYLSYIWINIFMDGFMGLYIFIHISIYIYIQNKHPLIHFF